MPDVPKPQRQKLMRVARRLRRVPIIHREAPPGSVPGTVIIDPEAPKPHLAVHAYGPDAHVEAEIHNPSEARAYLDQQWPVVWVNVDGLGDQAILQTLGEMFHIHRLALEDVVNVHQRAKFEQYEENVFIVVRMIHTDPTLQTEQVSIFICRNAVVTFQERIGDSFDQVRNRITKGLGRIRKAGPDFLTYALIDALIDAYFPVIERYGDQLETLEEQVLSDPEAEIAPRIHAIKRDLLLLRRAILPHREMISVMLRDESPFIEPETRIYLRDIYDHVIQLLDMVETYRELSSGLLDVHLTSVSNRMNEIMKVLTIFAAIFIPLTFLVGIYGMNFDPDIPGNLPETKLPYAYPVLLIVMALIAAGLLVYFRRKGWIGRRPRPRRKEINSADEKR